MLSEIFQICSSMVIATRVLSGIKNIKVPAQTGLGCGLNGRAAARQVQTPVQPD
jgi:hypothetical protein